VKEDGKLAKALIRLAAQVREPNWALAWQVSWQPVSPCRVDMLLDKGLT